jgi:flagellar hook-associated protein 1 FlgK
LDTLAQTLADQVNGALANGLTLTNDPPAQPLFTYDANIGVASTLTLSSITAPELAAASATAPGGNGNAVALEALSRAPQINGLTFTGYYGAFAARLGRELESARQSESTTQTLLDQAENFRQQVTGVSLDEEAAQLIQFQRAYQAVAQMFRTVNELTESVVNLLR